VALALQADGWWLRSDIIWAKPNPMPESCRDRPTSAYEHVFLLTKRARYYYDADAVREDAEYGRRNWSDVNGNLRRAGGNPEGMPSATVSGGDPSSGRNLRNVWTIATQAFPGVHYATFPTELAARAINAGTSERGCCAACGAPWVRLTEETAEYAAVKARLRATLGPDFHMKRAGADAVKGAGTGTNPATLPPKSTTTGWAASCTCAAEVVPCTVLDPFSGAGTTALVADRLQRHAIAIDLSHEYRDMAAARIAEDAGMFADIGTATLDESYDRPMRDLFANAAD
jgi:hypothetical protein